MAKDDFPKLSNPARSALFEAGYTQLEQLRHVKMQDILKLHGMGKKGIAELREALAEKGWAFLE